MVFSQPRIVCANLGAPTSAPTCANHRACMSQNPYEHWVSTANRCANQVPTATANQPPSLEGVGGWRRSRKHAKDRYFPGRLLTFPELIATRPGPKSRPATG